jgi:hypothetical protein
MTCIIFKHEKSFDGLEYKQYDILLIDTQYMFKLSDCYPHLEKHKTIFINKTDLIQFYNKFRGLDNYKDIHLAYKIKYDTINTSIYEYYKEVSVKEMTEFIKSCNNSDGGVFNEKYYINTLDMLSVFIYELPYIYINIDYIFNIINKQKYKVIIYMLCLKTININIPTCVKKSIFTISNIL